MHYPVLQYPTKVKSLSLDKTPSFQGKLSGIKEYLIFDDGTVFNVRFRGIRGQYFTLMILFVRDET
jgi:hypothetical protein